MDICPGIDRSDIEEVRNAVFIACDIIMQNGSVSFLLFALYLCEYVLTNVYIYEINTLTYI